MRDCLNITSRGREGKQVAPNVPKEDVPKAKAHFYALWTRGLNPDENNDDDEVKSLNFTFSDMSLF